MNLKLLLKSGITLSVSNSLVQAFQLYLILLCGWIGGFELIGVWGGTISLMFGLMVIIGHRCEISVPRHENLNSETLFLQFSRKLSLYISIPSFFLSLCYFIFILDQSIWQSILLAIFILIGCYQGKFLNYAIAVSVRKKYTSELLYSRLLQVLVGLLSSLMIFFYQDIKAVFLTYLLGQASAVLYLRKRGSDRFFDRLEANAETKHSKTSPAQHSDAKKLIKTCLHDSINAFANAMSSRILPIFLPVITTISFSGIYFSSQRVIFFVIPLLNSTIGSIGRQYVKKLDTTVGENNFISANSLIVKIVVFISIGYALLFTMGIYFFQDEITKILGQKAVVTLVLLVSWASTSLYGTFLANLLISQDNYQPFRLLNISLLIARGVLMIFYYFNRVDNPWEIVNLFSIVSLAFWFIFIFHVEMNINKGNQYSIFRLLGVSNILVGGVALCLLNIY